MIIPALLRGATQDELAELVEYIRREEKRLKRARSISNKRGLDAKLDLVYWLKILLRHEFSCAYCGDYYTTIDHVLPQGSGGGTTPRNCVPCCGSCNTRKAMAVWL